MVNIFSGAEIAEIGIQIEKNGRDFYNALERQSNIKEARDVFHYLAGEEEKHIKVFEQIRSSLESYEPESYSGEFADYMKSLAEGYIFTRKNKGLEIARQIKNEKEAVEKGIDFERDSIVFYEGMKKMVLGANIKTIEELAAQERLHLEKLMQLRNEILKERK